MTCEDYYEEEKNAGILEKAVQIVGLLASRPTSALARFLPEDARKALATVRLTVSSVLRR